MFIGRRAAVCIAVSNDRMSRTLRENSEREVAARDRVDITLAEYTRMKDTIEKLSAENRTLRNFFGKIGLPIDAPILPDSIHKMTCCNADNFLDFSQRFLIEFSCDMSRLLPEQRRQFIDDFKQI